MLLSSTALAVNPADEIAKYPAWIKNGCLQITSTRTRVSKIYDWHAALACAEASWDQYQQDRLLESQIEANLAQAELDRELARELRKR